MALKKFMFAAEPHRELKKFTDRIFIEISQHLYSRNCLEISLPCLSLGTGSLSLSSATVHEARANSIVSEVFIYLMLENVDILSIQLVNSEQPRSSWFKTKVLVFGEDYHDKNDPTLSRKENRINEDLLFRLKQNEMNI